jgi:holo-[acyl-carrier protein] synthase
MEKQVGDAAFLNRIFTPAELAYFHEKGDGPQTLAGIFAAKEAVVKALGCGFTVDYRDIEITPDSLGAPRVTLYNAAKWLLGARKPEVSIAHESEYAVASAIILS